MIRTTKRCVTFNIYARNFNFHNEMKATIILSQSCVVFLCSMKHTKHAYKRISVTSKRCSLPTRNCDSTKEMKLTPHKKADVPR